MTIKTVAQVCAAHGLEAPGLVTARIGGVSLPASAEAETVQVLYPATEEPVTRVQEAGPAEVDAAVAAARASFESGVWSQMPVSRRQAVMRQVTHQVATHRDELAVLESLCAGLPCNHLIDRQVPRAAENFSFFADYIGHLAGETFEQMDGYLTAVTREPAGVAALLAPWNAPLALASMQIASCIAFGNSCVVKPSEHTPWSVLRLVELMEEAGVPAGVVNVVNGRGPVTGQALVAHPGIDRIAFTGGTATARGIMAAAAPNLTPVHFELGGKSANIVFDDADLEAALDGSLVNIFSNSGQICIAGSRILVQRRIAEPFIERFVARTAQLRIGDPSERATEIGPLAFAGHRDRVLEYFRLACDEGAEILAGGGAAEGFERGYFVQPTVARVADNRLRVCQEEVFGPFATIQVFDDVEQAIAIANDSAYGLVAYAWTGRLALAMELQQRIRAGTLWINTPLARDLRAPFGGFKDSGIGRDGPRQCADFYTEEKASIVPRGPVTIRKMGMEP